MMRRLCKLAPAVVAIVLWAAIPEPVRAAIEVDPQALYATMQRANAQAAERGWHYVDHVYYLSTIFDAGRAYALFRRDDPQYGEIAKLAITVAAQLHYNPLTSDDAALWYVREAATYVAANGDDVQRLQSRALLQRVDTAETNSQAAARFALTDALAVTETFKGDSDALARLIVAEVRAYQLSHDPAIRATVLHQANDPRVPLVRVPDPEAPELFALAQSVVADPHVDATIRDDARRLLERRDHTPQLQVIARVRAIPHDERLTAMAPADEYFGQSKLSPIGIRNEIRRIGQHLDAGWGTRMTAAAITLETAVRDWQHQYPHDLTLPQYLLDVERLLERIESPPAAGAARGLRSLLLVEYAGTTQARSLGGS